MAQALTLSRLLACSSWWKPAAMLCVALGEAHVEGSEALRPTAREELDTANNHMNDLEVDHGAFE